MTPRRRLPIRNQLMRDEDFDVLFDAAKRQAESQALVGKSEYVPSRDLWVDYPESEAEQAWRAYEEWCQR